MPKKAYYTDPAGEKVPAKYIKPYDKLRDRIALRIEKMWLHEENRLAKIKADTAALIEQLMQAAEKEADVSLGGRKGNVQFRSFDGSVTVSLDRQYRTEFDERLQIAQTLISEAIAEMTDNVDDADLEEIARRAFQPRKSGNLDMQRIRDLRSYNVKHPKWQKACQIISECERTIGHRDYIRVTTRRHADENPKTIKLDIAHL